MFVCTQYEQARTNQKPV